jgi:phosphoenolpyruvate carboxylase
MAPQAVEAEDKDLPLREDIRLLGRILGDTVREQAGAAVFDTVESIRQNAVRFHRDEDAAARRELEATLNGLPPTEALQIIRAFGFFSHLANIAEDQHHIRRTRAHALTASAPRDGTMANALARARDNGIPPVRLRTFFANAKVVPVLTAHPTEVRRKSTIDRERDVADLLAERDRFPLTAAELKANETALRCAVLTLWQTSPLRRTRLRVIDEVANGLAYYDYTFLHELPRFYAALEDELADQGIAAAGERLASFLRMGSWIGSDRDGNPFVTEGVLRAALRAQSSRAFRHYLEELHLLGGELSLDSRLVEISQPLAELAGRSPDRSPNREHEPYRRAITGIYAAARDRARP